MMKSFILAAACAACALSASAQYAEGPRFCDNWSLGVQGGVATPLTHNPFFKSMRPVVGLQVKKQLTPVFGIGAEGYFGINTSSWKGRTHSSTVFDDSYVGLYGTADLFNLFGGYDGTVRPFTIEAVAGAGWGHMYETAIPDHNYFGTRVGLNFNFNVSDYVTINVSPSVYYDMSDGGAAQSSASYNANRATFNLMAGVTYHFGGNGFKVVRPYDQAEIDALNGQINDLRAATLAATQANAALQDENAVLAAQVVALQNAPVPVVKEVQENNFLQTVRYVFYKIGSSTITADQKPNVEMIADYLKDHPKATLVVKGYASQDGNPEFNEKLAQRRAESVKNMLVKTYKISADRIDAQGEGIGHMFDQESWNRVSICIINADEK
ncbi:MAG: OmpA family protein [Clostridium sp.]|nr:OmpA family protein [Clostridium sp.]